MPFDQDDADLQQWLDQQDTDYLAEQAELRANAKAAARVPFAHMQFNLRREMYARALNLNPSL